MVIKILKIYAFFVNSQLNSKFGLITILVGNNYAENNSIRIDSILADTLKAIVTDLDQNGKIVRPVKPRKNKTEKYSPDEFKKFFINRFDTFKTKANKAVNAASKKEAWDIWISLFGDDFPDCDEHPEQAQDRSYSIARETRPWGK